MGASRAFAKSRNQEILKRRTGGVSGGASGGSVRSRSSNSEGKGKWQNIYLSYQKVKLHHLKNTDYKRNIRKYSYSIDYQMGGIMQEEKVMHMLWLRSIKFHPSLQLFVIRLLAMVHHVVLHQTYYTRQNLRRCHFAVRQDVD